MMFLIAKIFFYLLMAGGIGAAAGWLLRNLQALQVEERAARDVAEAKTKLPQMESLLRGRDEQVTKLKAQLNEAKAQLKQQARAVQDAQLASEKHQRELARLQRGGTGLPSDGSQTNVKILQLDDDNAADAASDERVGRLQAEVSALKAQLAAAQQRSGDVDAELMRVECEALAGRLQATERALEAARKELELEQQKVLDLERERQLQNRSLQVLNQQLELARKGRAASA